jgi:hypothetical protein
MSAYVVFQIYNAVPEGQAPDPLMLTSWMIEADDEQGAVEALVALGIFTNGTVHSLGVEATLSFDVAVNPDVEPSKDPLVPAK